MKKLFFTVLVLIVEVVLASKKKSQQFSLIDKAVITGKHVFKDAILTLFIYTWLFLATVGTVIYGISFVAVEVQSYFGMSDGQRNGVVALILILNIAILLVVDWYREKKINRTLGLVPAVGHDNAVKA